MTKMVVRVVFSTLSIMLLVACQHAADPDIYDIALVGGRVMDPESGRDTITNVAISNGKIVAIAADSMRARQVLDVSGLVVAPGFIDLHNHSPTPLSQRYQAMDGVTTTLDLEAGAFPIAQYGSLLKDGARLNYGASTGHASIRVKVMSRQEFSHPVDAKDKINYGNEAFKQKANDVEIEEIRALLTQSLNQGGLGIGFLLDYLSDAVSDAEMRMLFDVAGRRQVPVFVHIRRGLAGDISGLKEIIAVAKETNAAVHICHLQHSAMQATDDFLQLIRKARAEGLDITTEVLPFNAGSTSISAAVFKRDWQSIFNITYADVEWAATGERFNKEMWEEYQQKYPGGAVIHHYVKEAWTRTAIAAPDVMVVSDGLPAMKESIKVPPQGIGSFARVIGRYVREEKALGLMTALKKMTIMPAQRLEWAAPAFKNKGRIKIGADADITVFDPDTIIDNTTYAEPYQASSGIMYLLVNGELVIRGGVMQENVFPGKRITGKTVN